MEFERVPAMYKTQEGRWCDCATEVWRRETPDDTRMYASYAEAFLQANPLRAVTLTPRAADAGALKGRQVCIYKSTGPGVFTVYAVQA